MVKPAEFTLIAREAEIVKMELTPTIEDGYITIMYRLERENYMLKQQMAAMEIKLEKLTAIIAAHGIQ